MPEPRFSWGTWFDDFLANERARTLMNALGVVLALILLLLVCFACYWRDNDRRVEFRWRALWALAVFFFVQCAAILAEIASLSRGKMLIAGVLAIVCFGWVMLRFADTYQGESSFRARARAVAHIFRPTESSEWMRRRLRVGLLFFATLHVLGFMAAILLAGRMA